MTEALTIRDITIDISEVCRYLGYVNGRRPGAPISSLISNQLAEALSLIQPSYSYVIREVIDVKGSQIFIENSVTLTSHIIAQILSKCQRVALFVTTIGPRLEERVSQLMREGEILKAAVLDAVGSEAVEKVACWLEGNLREMVVADNAEISLRYSPGYCDWDIKQQRALFRAYWHWGFWSGDSPLLLPFCLKKDCQGRRK